MSHQNTSRRCNFSNMQQNSFTKETPPLLSILTLPVVENQLENSARNQPHPEYVLLDILMYIIISNISQMFIKNKRKKPSHLLRKHLSFLKVLEEGPSSSTSFDLRENTEVHDYWSMPLIVCNLRRTSTSIISRKVNLRSGTANIICDQDIFVSTRK